MSELSEKERRDLFCERAIKNERSKIVRLLYRATSQSYFLTQRECICTNVKKGEQMLSPLPKT
jgi:hypothetical protein